ncbi:TPA: phage tail protein [Pseudomonas aeruginosa]|uniref:phage tail protein n=1 Tax=Pseudomonas aeruginosa TaxID=287 RepID=UPI000624D54B|nr:phage tail protein [Pseudomonas aeruginosa]AKF98714.1 minor tail family protein [Pseudomonas aeruginosa]EKX7256484.1 phage tail protein [Pseudomonas aeruginosa]KAA5558626.1 phage tail protein [Pseudomonas aeruginosa]KAA5559218.1 phage tail protein [Pseudomonas aeruginosa]KAA5691649.1 phage tail protein [Pseudomonas aeruginosa]
MAVETFTWCVHSQSSGTTDYATLNRKFGDGYEQVAENGLNNVAQSWNISISGTGAKIKEIRNFLDRHAGAKSFLWTPPLGELGFYRGTAPSISGGGGDYYTLTATFTQAYHP